MLVLAGKAGDAARALAVEEEPEMKLITTIEAETRFEAMTKYNKLLDREEFEATHEQDYWIYIDELGNTAPPVNN